MTRKELENEFPLNAIENEQQLNDAIIVLDKISDRSVSIGVSDSVHDYFLSLYRLVAIYESKYYPIEEDNGSNSTD